MNVTPSEQMFQVMTKMAEAFVGEAPSDLDHGEGARQRRAARSQFFELMHMYTGLCMREGVNRAIREAHERVHGPQDMQDRNAMAKAVDDATAGRVLVPGLKH